MIAASGDNQEYLQTLSLLARMLRRPGVIQRLNTTKDAHEIYDLLAHELDQDYH